MSRNPRVVYWNNVPAPYMVDRFNAVADRGRLNFEVWFSRRDVPWRSWKHHEEDWRFSYHFLRTLEVGGRAVVMPTQLARADIDLIVSLYAGHEFVLGRSIAALRGLRTVYWVVPTSGAWFPRRSWRESAKRILLSTVDAVFVNGADGRAFSRGYGTPDERIFELPHATNVALLKERLAQALPRRDEIRRAARLSGIVFLYVGRLWKGKGVDRLIALFERVSGTNPDCTLLLVGDGTDEHGLRRMAQDLKLDNVIFAGYADESRLVEWLAASDVFVFPTLGDPYGLVVDEAMACGIPVVSTDAAGDIRERIVDGETGFVVPVGDWDRFATAMTRLGDDHALRSRAGELAARAISTRTPERWARDFEHVVERVMALPTRRRSERKRREPPAT